VKLQKPKKPERYKTAYTQVILAQFDEKQRKLLLAGFTKVILSHLQIKLGLCDRSN
jgi:hypothetical protein